MTFIQYAVTLIEVIGSAFFLLSELRKVNIDDWQFRNFGKNYKNSSNFFRSQNLSDSNFL